MSGSDRRRAPTTDAELAREFDRRIAALEHPSATRVGKWVLSTGDGDDLLASFVGGGSVVLSPPPKVGENPDDTEKAFVLPHLELTRAANQRVSEGPDVPIEWDNVEAQIGEWDISGTPITEIPIPVSGLWLVVYSPQWNTSSASWANHQINVDGDAAALDRVYPGGQLVRTGLVTMNRSLQEGQVLTPVVRTGSGNHNVGTSGWNQNVVTRIELTCLRREDD
ncbi:hypothetical protein [Tomitella gaofuii]|uniref:hypothetical protein n=1 Tax=Tomitella gaofuii TaxID=2760083 RepID=UPI0015FE1BAA|nr:hypothetical protein [Tomitella gaofuii]